MSFIFFEQITKAAQITVSVMLFTHVCAYNFLKTLSVVPELQKKTQTILLDKIPL